MTQGDSSGTLKTSLSNEWTMVIKHRDATDEKGGRKITVLCYFGEAGLEGGELNIYSNEDGEENTVVEKVTPTSGTIVIFRQNVLQTCVATQFKQTSRKERKQYCYH